MRCSWCDTPYTSWAPEGGDMSVDDIMTRILEFDCPYCVITGGEPTVAVGMGELTQKLRRAGLHVTLETNATMPPGDMVVDLASLSPKLSNSNPDPIEHPTEASMHIATLRIKASVIEEWIKKFEYQLKFVVSGDAELQEIQALLKRLNVPVSPEKVLLMPEGTDLDTLAARRSTLVDLCKTHGYRYCSRLHIELFGNTRGT